MHDRKVIMEPNIWPDGAYIRWHYKPRKPKNLAAVEYDLIICLLRSNVDWMISIELTINKKKF